MNMRSREYLWDVCMSIYRQMYKESEPSADFDKLMKEGETKKPDWFMKYYLSEKRQIEILEKHTKKYKLNEREKHEVSKELFLGCSPSMVDKNSKSD